MVSCPGDVVDDRYLVGELLGRGGMAEVFRAIDLAADQDVVAVKLLRSVERGSDRRFAAEAQVLAGLDHPGMVRLRGSGTHAGVPYLVLDLADGGSLARDLSAGPVGLARALDIGEQVAEALACAHRLGVVHRDVKPSNILFDDRGRVRLADFGIARVAGSPDLTATGHLIGSAPYLAPEQAAGERAGPAVDVYALGLVVIECLTGRPCYPGGPVEAAVARLQRQPDIPAGLPGWLRTVLSAMTARDPARRPPADAVAEALRERTADPILPSTALHDVHAVAEHRRGAAPTSRGSDAATATLTVADVADDLGPAESTGPRVGPDRTDRTVAFPSGSRPRPPQGTRGGRRRLRMLAAVAAVCLAALGLVAWASDGGRAPATGSGDVPAETSTTTSPAPTTVTTPPPGSAEGPPEPGPHDRPGNGRGRANGGDKGGKGAKGD